MAYCIPSVQMKAWLPHYRRHLNCTLLIWRGMYPFRHQAPLRAWRRYTCLVISKDLLQVMYWTISKLDTLVGKQVLCVQSAADAIHERVCCTGVSKAHRVRWSMTSACLHRPTALDTDKVLCSTKYTIVNNCFRQIGRGGCD